MPALLLIVLPLAAAAWVAALLAAPVSPAALATPVYLFGSFLCHQLAERSFHIDGIQLPVCARCLGIYAGGAVGALLAMFPVGRALSPLGPPGVTRKPVEGSGSPGEPDRVRPMLVIAALPTAITFVLEWSGVWQPGNAVRAAAGLVLGGGVALVVMGAIHYERWQRRRRLVPPPHSTPM